MIEVEQLKRSIHCPSCSSLHPHWNRCLAPALHVAPGQRFTFVSPDASNGLLGRHSTAADISGIDFRKLDPLCGPIHVEGAEPGDALMLEILDLELGNWGWTGLLPDFGLLSDQFPEPFFRGFDLTPGFTEILGERFALKPMLGVLGVAPGQDGDFPSIAPTRAGGNIDVRYLTPGAKLYLPVFNHGALISGGDGHALQGEGEISGTAIEAAMSATIKVELIKQRHLQAPFADISTKPYAETEYRDFLGIGPDLFTAARDAVRFAVDEMSFSLKVEPFEAYAVLGMIGELRIHEIVDKPNWVVGCLVPRRLFGSFI
jgi:acetamidase/formamidase